MTTPHPDLPDFANPPLVEVVLSVQFEPIEKMRLAHLGLLWSRFREDFPVTEQHPALPQQFEEFDDTASRGQSVQFRVVESIPLPRIWFLDAAGHHLLQVQSDRFIQNWRKINEASHYPRYEEFRARFSANVELFENYLREEDLGALQINQCEVTYVNFIDSGPCWTDMGQVEGVLRTWHALDEQSVLQRPEDVRLAMRFRLPAADRADRARLHITLEPFRPPDPNSTSLLLNLTCRGKPREANLKSALDFIDHGRDWIVRGFDAVTTPCQHAAWGKTNE